MATATGGAASPGPNGPRLLVLVIAFAGERLLLIKRGVAPYVGKWAPPGGYIEEGESAEAAAVRELWEETRLTVQSTDLLPRAVISLPAMNQVHLVYFVRLAEPPPVCAVPPESQAAGWFSESELGQLEHWDPAAEIDFPGLFENVRNLREGFVQWNEEFRRLILPDGRLRYLWKSPAAEDSSAAEAD